MPAGQSNTHEVYETPRFLAIDGLCRVELLPAAPYEAAYTPDRPVIGFAFEAQSGMHAFAGSRRSDFAVRANHLSWVPAGCDVYSQSEKGGEYFRIILEHSQEFSTAGGRRFSDVIDARAIGAGQALRRQMISHAPDPIACEAQIQILIDRIMGILCSGHETPREAAWMTPQRLRRISDLVEARLGERLSVHELAAGLGLSAGFFSRAFRAAAGTSPHDYIIDRRLARARFLLRDPALGLAAIAQAAGFSSHAHMSAVFKDRLGASPSAMRRALVD
jgi:AraC family transcriptional regulator